MTCDVPCCDEHGKGSTSEGVSVGRARRAWRGSDSRRGARTGHEHRQTVPPRSEGWATAKEALAAKCYQEHFGVEPEDIYPLEGLVESEHVVDDSYEVHQIPDYGGIDRIIGCGTRHVYVAQWWQPNKRGGVDLSLRVDIGVEGRSAEQVKWRTAPRSRGFYPSVIAFGIYDSVIEGFTEVHLIDTRRLLDVLDLGILGTDRHSTDDGMGALYVPVEDLDTASCLIESWNGVTA